MVLALVLALVRIYATCCDVFATITSRTQTLVVFVPSWYVYSLIIVFSSSEFALGSLTLAVRVLLVCMMSSTMSSTSTTRSGGTCRKGRKHMRRLCDWARHWGESAFERLAACKNQTQSSAFSRRVLLEVIALPSKTNQSTNKMQPRGAISPW